MSERYDPYGEPAPAAGEWPQDQGTVRHEPDDWRERTTPGMTAIPPLQAAPTSAHPAVGGGYPGRGYAGQPYAGPAYPGDPYTGGAGAVTTPDYTGRPIASRRPDGLAGLLLVLAGLAAGVSLILRWVTGSDVTGQDLVRSAWHQLRAAPSELVHSGLWQPAAAVAGGAILFVLGLLMFVPARGHRFLGVLALLVSLGAGAGVLVAISGVHWHLGRFQIGLWFAVAVAVLGFLGALKAMMTGPRSAARF